MSTVKVVAGVTVGAMKSPSVSKGALLKLTSALRNPGVGVGTEVALRSIARAPKVAKALGAGDA